MKTAEKPDFRENQYWEGVLFGEFSRKFKSGKFKRDEDAWLEKLKTSFDESIADCHHSLELVAAKLGEYTEKAEKLEAVRTFVEDCWAKDGVPMWVLKRLDSILGTKYGKILEGEA